MIRLRNSLLSGLALPLSFAAAALSCSAGGSGGPQQIAPGQTTATPNKPAGTDPAATTNPTPAPLPAGGGVHLTSSCTNGSLAGAPSLRRLSRRELENSLRDVFPSLGAAWSSGLSADNISSSGFDNDNTLLLVSKQTARELATAAESVATNISSALPQLLPCAATSADQACAGQFLDTQGRRLFRRPLTADERTSFLTFWNTAQTATGDFTQSIGWLTRALIESPDFIYRREIGAPGASGSLQLDQYEIATELAYTFSGTGPSAALLDRASRAELSSPEVLVATAHDLLMTAGRDLVHNFFDSYVGYSRVTTIAKAGVNGFADQRESMLAETRNFIDEVIFNRGGGGRELFTANFTTPTTALAGFYGFEPASVPASNFDVVPRPAGQGIGLLAQGSVLATLAQPNGSSPTKRGQWVYKHLLCNEVPPVPPNIPTLGAPQPGKRTTRQRYEEDHAQGSCQGCHGRWDPIGFGFEHFDEAGRYRADEGGLTIDTASHVPQNGVDLFTFDGEEDLMTQLVEEPLVHECMSQYLATYAFGENVACGAETRRAEFVDGTLGFIDYLASLAAEPQFTQRSPQ